METTRVLDKISRRPGAAGQAMPGRVRDRVAEVSEESSLVPATIQKEFASPHSPNRPPGRRGTPATCLRPQFQFQDDSRTSPRVLMWTAETDDVRGLFRFDFWTSKQTTPLGPASFLELLD